MVIQSIKLLYFSPTGTTRKILGEIVEAFGVENSQHIDLTIPSLRIKGYRKIKGDLTVIGVPVYTGRVALEAVHRLQQFTAEDSPAVIVVVYGNREYEDALLELKNIVAEQGFTPIAAGAFIGEHSFSTEETPIARGRPDVKDLDRARLFGKMVRKKILETESMDSFSPFSIPGNFPYRERSPTLNTSPETNDVLCIRCVKCAEVCPVATITVDEGGVTTGKTKCILCCSCVKICPTGARRLEDQHLAQFIKEKLSVMCKNRKVPEFFL